MSSRPRVSDYGHFGRSYFVNDDGTFADGGEALHAAGCVGLAAAIKVGLMPRVSICCALYEHDSNMWLQIDRQKFCLSANDLRPHLVSLPFARRFTLVNSNGSAVFDQWYWFAGVGDSFPDSGDFLEYVTRSCATAHAIVRFVCYWRARSANVGPVTSEELKEVEACIRTAGEQR